MVKPDYEETEEMAMDKGADFVLEAVADYLGVKDWSMQEGSETWDGDVLATLHKIFELAGIDDRSKAVNGQILRVLQKIIRQLHSYMYT